jgi:hypothetical protein
MTSDKWDGAEKRVEPDLDIKDGGIYADIVRKSYFSNLYGDEDFRKYVPKDVLKIVDESDGRLKVKIIPIGDPNDTIEDSYTEYRIQKVERRKEPTEHDSPLTLEIPKGWTAR